MNQLCRGSAVMFRDHQLAVVVKDEDGLTLLNAGPHHHVVHVAVLGVPMPGDADRATVE